MPVESDGCELFDACERLAAAEIAVLRSRDISDVLIATVLWAALGILAEESPQRDRINSVTRRALMDYGARELLEEAGA